MVSDSDTGDALPLIKVQPPGPTTRQWLALGRRYKAPMGPPPQVDGPSLVYAAARGSNVWDTDGNRYVDLCAGFGSVLLGHCHPELESVVRTQTAQLVQGLGDVFDSVPKLRFLERVTRLLGEDVQGIVGLSGADAVTAAIKTCVLATGRHELIAFEGSYHGLSYAPLAVSGLREGYFRPFEAQLNQHITWLPFPDHPKALEQLCNALSQRTAAAVMLEPILGRGGIRPLGSLALKTIAATASSTGTLLIADEVWTGLGRSGAWLWCTDNGVAPDLVCLGKGLGGGLPVSVCLAKRSLFSCWQRDPEVVHTSTHAGAPLGCAVAEKTLSIIERDQLVARASELGSQWRAELAARLAPFEVEVRGAGLMIGLDVAHVPGAAFRALQSLLRRGYIASTGGGTRDTLILTPALTVPERQLHAFAEVIGEVLEEAIQG